MRAYIWRREAREGGSPPGNRPNRCPVLIYSRGCASATRRANVPSAGVGFSSPTQGTRNIVTALHSGTNTGTLAVRAATSGEDHRGSLLPNHPWIRICGRRMNTIIQKLLRGTLNESTAGVMKWLAKGKMERAIFDQAYANSQIFFIFPVPYRTLSEWMCQKFSASGGAGQGQPEAASGRTQRHLQDPLAVSFTRSVSDRNPKPAEKRKS